METKESVSSWEQIEQALEEDDWDVHVRLMWVAEARKGRDYEQGIGLTREEALEQLAQLTRLDAIIGVP